MIRTNIRRLALPVILGAVAWTSYGVGLAPTSGVHTVFAASKSPVKVLAKEVNHKYVFGSVKTTIKVGQTVMWKNPTDAPHTVTSTTAGWTYDKKLNIGKTLQVTFKKAGTFHYKCSYHPGMVGTVIVVH